ncbi:hypothetical protein BKA64DRAFT_672877 [Cadophora sp. MPI-SDFR-AT-0126]|nr:hypothetical protein BKA64DRAFT_672877 [Leotiomycetes sp. MPI-SDFR-AT-0126]
MPSSTSVSLTQISFTSEAQSKYLQTPPWPQQHNMHRTNLLTRSRTAPQLPPISDVSPINLSFMDPFSPPTPNNRRHQQLQQVENQNLTHHSTQSISCLPSPHPNSLPQKHLTWPLRRTSFASIATKSLPHLPLRPTHLLHRLRSSVSSLVVTKHQYQHQHPNPQHSNQKHHERRESGSSEGDDSWRMDWDAPFTGENRGDDYGYGEMEESCIPGFCLRLPPEVSRDTSEIEYLRRLEREAMSARMMGIMA